MVQAAPTPQVAYQGRLTEAGLPVTGTRSFTFAILDSQGTELWNSGAQDVSVNNGLYAVELGGTGMPAIPATLLGTPNLKLHLAINGVALTPDTDLVPALQARSAFEFSGPLAGDVGGTQNATMVLRLNGVPLDATAPAAGQALVFNGSSWAPATAAGPMGPEGPAGPAGPTGATGPQGPIGLTGALGPQGPAGATGPQGLPGTAGKTILSGPVPPAASQGVDGDFYLDTAASVLYGPKGVLTAGAWPTPGTSLVGPAGATGATGPQGPIGLTGATGPQGPIGLTGATGATGATGPQGATGLTGATGPQGPIGLTGATGPQGLTGAAGAAATVSVGTTTTGAAGTAAAVTNSGTSSAAVLNFTIPQGAAGPNGVHVVSGTTSTYLVGSSDLSVVVTSTANPTIVLPAASSNPNRMIQVMAGGLKFSLSASGAPIFDGTGSINPTWTATPTVTIAFPYWTLICVSDGTSWYVN